MLFSIVCSLLYDPCWHIHIYSGPVAFLKLLTLHYNYPSTVKTTLKNNKRLMHDGRLRRVDKLL